MFPVMIEASEIELESYGKKGDKLSIVTGETQGWRDTMEDTTIVA